MRFSRSDAAIFSLVLVFSSILLLFFLRDVNRVAERNGGVVLGAVTFRKNTTTRRSESSMRWEKLVGGSAVYRNDTIRTGDLSEASMTFKDGSTLSLYENAMIRIGTAGSAQSFEILGGAIHMTGGSGDSHAPKKIRAGKSVIDITPGSVVSISAVGTAVSVDVSSGAVSLVSPGGQVSQIAGNETLNIDTKSDKSTIVQRKITLAEPEQGARFFSSASAENISLKAKSTDEQGKYFFEISKDFAFSEIEKTGTAGAGPDGTLVATVPLPPGLWYWRVRAESGDASAASRLSVISTRAPEPVWPVDRAAIRFRKNLSPIVFSWTETPGASSYVLEFSRDSRGISVVRKFATALPGITVPDLAEGTWYWRAVPVFPEGAAVSIGVSPLREILVTRSGEMRPLRAVAPAEGSLYEIRNGIAGDIAFSWNPEADASSYELSVFSASDRLTPIASWQTEQSWLSLDGAKATFLAKAGSYFWSVSWKDAEGNLSPRSALRRIDGVDGRAAIKPLFPPDGYTVLETLVPAIRFVWKNGLTARTVLQLSRDSSFSKIGVEKEASDNFLEGLKCAAGLWFWRLVSYNADGSVFLVSESRTLRVALPFGSPVLIHPSPDSRFEVPDGDSFKFTWTRIGGADYYSCKLYPSDSAARPLFSAEYLDAHECDIPMGTYPEGTYRVVLQAFARDSEAGTRIVGIPGRELVSFKKIFPVEPVSPTDGSKISGLTARRKGVVLEWRSAEATDSLSLIVTRDDLLYPVRFVWKPGMTTFVLPNLEPGTYSWKIRALRSGLEISSKTQPTFTVLPVPPLDAPIAISPPDKAVFDYTYIDTKRSIRFEWRPVSGATDYTLKILPADRSGVLFKVERLKATAYTLENLSCLDRGDFIWEVSAQNYWNDGELDQTGLVSAIRFSVSLPELRAPILKLQGAEYYGL